MDTAQPSELACLPQELLSHNDAQDLLLLQDYVCKLSHAQQTLEATYASLQQTELLAGVIHEQDCRAIRTACCCLNSLRIRVEARANVTERRRPDGSVGMALVLPALTDCRWWFESLLVHSGVSSATRRKATGADHKKTRANVTERAVISRQLQLMQASVQPRPTEDLNTADTSCPSRTSAEHFDDKPGPCPKN